MSTKKPKAKKKGWSLDDVPIAVPDPSTWRIDWRGRATDLRTAFNHALLETPEKKKASEAGAWAVKGWAEETLRVFYAVDVWCRKHRIEPKLWVTWVVRRTTKAGAPSPSLAHLFSESSVVTFRDDVMADLDRAREEDLRLKSALQAPLPPEAQEPHWGHEQAKWNYAQRGLAVVCFERVDITAGYHPKSKTCEVCPLKQQCMEAQKAKR